MQRKHTPAVPVPVPFCYKALTFYLLARIYYRTYGIVVTVSKHHKHLKQQGGGDC
jgi:hypothetical protein